MGGFAAVMMGASSVMGAYGQYQAGKAQNEYYQYLAKQNEEQAKEVVATGKDQSALVQDVASSDYKSVREDVAKTMGMQKTGLAASNIALSSGTAEDIARATFDSGLKDEASIRFNADMTSWDIMTKATQESKNLKRQAEAYRKSGKAAKAGGAWSAGATLLGGGATAYGYANR